MLKVNNLTVQAGEKKIIKGLNFELPKNTVATIFGPNGSGKSTFFGTLVGLGQYKITKGEILFQGKKINKLSIDQRNQLGISVMFQRPPSIKGVDLESVAFEVNENYSQILKQAEKVNVENFLEREINQNLSGGEIKRSELFQMSLDEKAQLYLFDEPDSGVDLENLERIGRLINKLVHQRGKSALIITHTGHILDHVKSNLGYVMIDGQIQCSEKPKRILERIKKDGYSQCFGCNK